MFRLAHISDVHMPPLPPIGVRDLLSKRITGYLNWRLNRSLSYSRELIDAIIDNLMAEQADHLAITGDLVNLALRSEISRAAQWLDDVSAGFANSHPLTVIGGNHDAYVPGSWKRALAAWQPHVQGDEDRKIVTGADFPTLKRRGDVSIISCNSANATPPFIARGTFRKSEAEKLVRILEEENAVGQFRIVLIHHPPVHGASPRFKRLQGIDRFQTAIKTAGAELILHGHTHLATLHWIEGAKARVPVAGVPATGQLPGALKPPAGYNLFEIDKTETGWHCLMRSFGVTELTALSPRIKQLNEVPLHQS